MQELDYTKMLGQEINSFIKKKKLVTITIDQSPLGQGEKI